jgi:hypothetical protein
MEYLLVHFPASRRVKVGSVFQGKTEELIELEAGTYIITLEPPINFAPKKQEVQLAGTTPLSPREVIFAQR